MKRYFYTLLHLFYPAGIVRVRIDQNQSVTHAQPYYSAGDFPAKENDPMIKKLVLTALTALVTLTLMACAPRTTSRALSPEEGAAYAAKVDDIVENMIVGFSENDYAKYTRDMPEDLTEGYESSIRQTADEISAEWGAYQGKTFDHAEDRGRYRVVIYHLVFEKEPDVTLDVYFNISDPNQVVGTNWASK